MPILAARMSMKMSSSRSDDVNKRTIIDQRYDEFITPNRQLTHATYGSATLSTCNSLTSPTTFVFMQDGDSLVQTPQTMNEPSSCACTTTLSHNDAYISMTQSASFNTDGSFTITAKAALSSSFKGYYVQISGTTTCTYSNEITCSDPDYQACGDRWETHTYTYSSANATCSQDVWDTNCLCTHSCIYCWSSNGFWNVARTNINDCPSGTNECCPGDSMPSQQVQFWIACADGPCSYQSVYPNNRGPWTSSAYTYNVCAGPRNLQYLPTYLSGWDKFEFLTQNTKTYTPPLVASNAVHCPITNLRIFQQDFTTEVDNNLELDFWVDGLTVKFNPRRVRTTMDFYIAGYTADGILQDYFKAKWIVCCDETFNPVGHFIISDVAYRLIMNNPVSFTFNSFTPVESNYLDITRYEIIHDTLNDGSSIITYPAPGCADPCQQLQYDISQLSSFRFQIRMYYSGKNGYSSSENPSGTYYTFPTFISINVQNMVIQNFITTAQTMLGMNGINYIMLLDADNHGAQDTMFHNDFRFQDFVCDSSLGCPGPHLVPSLYKSSSQSTLIQTAQVSDPVRVNGMETITIPTSSLSQISFFVAGGIPMTSGVFSTAVVGFSNLITIEIVCGSEQASVDVPSHTLPVARMSQTPGDYLSFSFASIFVFQSDKALCPLNLVEVLELNQAQQPEQYTVLCANQNAACRCMVSRTIFFGAMNAQNQLDYGRTFMQVTADATGYKICSIQVMGGDPLPGQAKYCFCEEPNILLNDPNIALFNTNSPLTSGFNYLIDNSYIITFRVKVSTAGRVYNDGAYIQITVIVCGGETLVNSPLTDAEGKFIKLFLSTTSQPIQAFFDEALFFNQGSQNSPIWQYQENEAHQRRNDLPAPNQSPWFLFDRGPADDSCRNKQYSIHEVDCVSSIVDPSPLFQLVWSSGNNITGFNIFLNTTMPTANFQFCIKETTEGDVSIGRLYEFEVCGRRLSFHSSKKEGEIYAYSVDLTNKEHKIKGSVYRDWFVNPSTNCTIPQDAYKLQMAMDPEQERFGLLDIHNATHFRDLDQFWNDIIFINSDLDIEILKESEPLHLVKQFESTDVILYLQPKTIGGTVINLRMDFTFVKSYNEQPMLVNGIDEEMTNIEVVVSYQQVLIGVSEINLYEFKEKPFDLEGDQPKVGILNGTNQTVPWAYVAQMRGRFFLVVDTTRLKVNDEGKNNFWMSIFDSISPLEPNIYEFSVSIEYKEKKQKLQSLASESSSPNTEQDVEDFEFDSFTQNEGEFNQDEEEELSEKVFDGIDDPFAENPKIQMSFINQQHAFNLTFDQDLIVKKFNDFSKVFQIKVQATYFMDETVGEQVKNISIKNEILSELSYPEVLPEWLSQDPIKAEFTTKDDKPPNLNFQWEVIEHTKSHIQIQLSFQEPTKVSESDYDIIKVRLIDSSSLRSAYSGLQVLDNEKLAQSCGETGQMCRRIPRYLEVSLQENLETQSSIQSFTIQSIIGSQLFLAVILQRAMNQLFNVIRPMQYIGLIMLIQIVYPAGLYGFISYLMGQTSFDVFQGEKAIEKSSDDQIFRNQGPLTDSFEEFEFKSMNFFLNSGSIIFPIVPGIIFFQYVVVGGMLSFVKANCSNPSLRKIGILVIKQKSEVAYQIGKMLFEGYLKLTMGTLLNLLSLYYAFKSMDPDHALRSSRESQRLLNEQSVNRRSELLMYFSTLPDALSSIFTLLSLVFYVIGMPAYIFYRAKQDFKLFSLEKEEFLATGIKPQPKSQIFGTSSIFWADNTSNTFASMVVPIFMLLRRLIVISTVIFMRDQPMFQVIPILQTTLFNLSYMLWTRRFLQQYHYYQELINEFVVYLISIAFLLFTNVSINNQRKDEIGWLLVLLISLNIAQILMSQIYITGKDLWRRNKVKQNEKSHDLKILEKIHRRKEIVRMMPGYMPQFGCFIEEREGIERCRAWKAQRDFLVKIEANFNSLEEEILFQRDLRVFKFQQRYQRLRDNMQMRLMFKIGFIKDFKQRVQQRVTEKIQDKISKKVLELMLERKNRIVEKHEPNPLQFYSNDNLAFPNIDDGDQEPTDQITIDENQQDDSSQMSQSYSTVLSRQSSSKSSKSGSILKSQKSKKSSRKKNNSLVPKMPVIEEEFDHEDSLRSFESFEKEGGSFNQSASESRQSQRLSSSQIPQGATGRKSKSTSKKTKIKSSSRNEQIELMNQSDDSSGLQNSDQDSYLQKIRGPSGYYSSQSLLSSKGFSTMGDFQKVKDEINLEANQEREQDNLKFYGPTINHAFNQQQTLTPIPLKVKRSHLKSSSPLPLFSSLATPAPLKRDITIQVLDQSKDNRDDIWHLKKSLETFIDKLQQTQYQSMFMRESKRVVALVNKEVEAMEIENQLMENQIKNNFFEQRKIFKNLTMKDFTDVMGLEGDLNELRDFDFMPKERMQFVKVLQKEPFINKQQGIAVNNLQIQRLGKEGVLKKPYNNAGVLGFVNNANFSFITSFLQCLSGFDELKDYYIKQDNYQRQVEIKHKNAPVLKFLSQFFQQTFMIETHPFENSAIEIKFSKFLSLKNIKKAESDPIELLNIFISLINDKFRPSSTLSFQDTILNFKSIDYQETVLKHFRQQNFTLMSKLFGSLVSEFVNCPKCFIQNQEFKDQFVVDLQMPLGLQEVFLYDLIAQYFKAPKSQGLSPPRKCSNCQKVISKGKLKRQFVQSPPILVLRIENKFDKQSNLRGIGEILINKELNFKMASTERTRQTHESLWQSQSTYETPSNHKMQRKVDKKMRNSNNYEVVAVICHSGRSKALGQFYAYVRRTISQEFLLGKISEFITQQELNDDVESDESSDSEDLEELIVLDRPYYIRHFPKSENDKHFVEPSIHKLGHKLDGLGEKSLAQVMVQKDSDLHNNVFTKKSRLYYRYQRVGHEITFMNEMRDDMVFDETGTLQELDQIKFQEQFLLRRTVYLLINLADKLEDFLDNLKSRLSRCFQQRKKKVKIDSSFTDQSDDQRVAKQKQQIFEQLRREHKRWPKQEVERQTEIKFTKAQEQQARDDLNLLKGQQEIWFEFIDDFHREVSFDFVVEEAKTKGYAFIYQNCYLDDQFNSNVKKLERAKNLVKSNQFFEDQELEGPPEASFMSEVKNPFKSIRKKKKAIVKKKSKKRLKSLNSDPLKAEHTSKYNLPINDEDLAQNQ